MAWTVTRVETPVQVVRESTGTVVGSTVAQVVVARVETPPVIVTTTQSGVTVVSGTVTPAGTTTCLTEFTPDGIYVGIAPLGSLPTAVAWQLYRVVDTDPHPVKIPDDAARHAWTERTDLTYIDG